jgi:two-component system OmpR family response regulator
MRLLLVEDDQEVGAMLSEALGYRRHVVDWVTAGADAVFRAREQRYDVVVLDVGLPDVSGLDVCRRIREQDREVGVIMLTGRGGVPQRVEGLDAGADDYLPKPVSLAELDARLRALARRGRRPVVDLLVARDLTVDPAARTVHRHGRPVLLVGREYSLVELLVRRTPDVVRRDELVAQLWDRAAEVSDNAVDVLVAGVRRKLDAPYEDAPLVETVRGVGYRLR